MPAIETPKNEEVSRQRWVGEHAAIRARLKDWQTLLAWLEARSGRRLAEREAGGAALRTILYFFKTFVIAHCRNEETILFQAFGEHPEMASRLQSFRQDHERYGVDLDRFERQLISFEFSGDPSALVTLGARIVRELREHLDAEDEILRERAGGRL